MLGVPLLKRIISGRKFSNVKATTYRYIKVRTDPVVMQVGIDLQKKFNTHDLISEITGASNWPSHPILSEIAKTFINIFDITILNPHLELVS